MHLLFRFFSLDRQRELKDALIGKILLPIFRAMKRAGITPSMLSAAGFVCHLAAVYFFITNYAGFVWSFSGFLFFDALDGTYARMTDQITVRGGYVDRILDTIGGVLFYVKGYWFLPHIMVASAGILFLLNTFLLYLTHKERAIGINRNLCYFSLFKWYQAGLIVDLIYLGIVCPIRLYYAIRRPSHT
jgi:hypothetical protein